MVDQEFWGVGICTERRGKPLFFRYGVADKDFKSLEETIILEIITVFSARLYGSVEATKTKKIVEELKKLWKGFKTQLNPNNEQLTKFCSQSLWCSKIRLQLGL